MNRILRAEGGGGGGGGALIAMEGGKYLVPLLRDQKLAFDDKLREAAVSAGWRSVPAPVRRRNREADDTQFDVMFFEKK